jgi:DNA sulfur modification protein DndB
MKNYKELNLPCLRGSVGTWVYYSTIVPFKELERIDTEHKIKEDKNLDKWLQRKLSERVEGIKKYLLSENERFFNSIIVGVYGELPDWYSLDLSVIEEKFKISISEEVRESLGILTLSGKEILFTIDGQHRIEAIKRAREGNEDRFKSDELSVIFVGHAEDEKGYVRTRKLFATINREAKKPTPNDLAIIDETYAYNIVARMIYARYESLKEKIILTENYDLDRNDHVHFTNLLNLVEVNKKLFKAVKYRESKYTSPTYDKREELFLVSTEFYDFVIANIEEYQEFFGGKKALSKFRNVAHKKPLNLLFLPVGISLIAELYSYFKAKKKIEFLKKHINKLDFDLYNGTFKFIFFNPVKNKIETGNKTLGRNLALYLLGEKISITSIKLKKSLAKAYSINELSPEFKTFQLPKKLI